MTVRPAITMLTIDISLMRIFSDGPDAYKTSEMKWLVSH